MVESILGGLFAVVGAAVVVLVTGVVLAVLLRLLDRVTPAPNRGVVPSHYESLFYTDPSNYPEYCVDCGTKNDPDYQLCKNCTAQLPSNDSADIDRDVDDVLDR